MRWLHRLLRQRGCSQNFLSRAMGSNDRSKVLCLFDVDGTVTPPRQGMSPTTEEFLQKAKAFAVLGLVGGSDSPKIAEQIGGMDCFKKYDYVFSENGLVSYKDGAIFHTQSISAYLSEEKLQAFINFCLKYMSELMLPVKRGTFVEFRKGMINVSPVGRNCTQPERDAFEAYDKEHKVRVQFIDALKEKFPNLDVEYSIGGQISFDVFPKGWDKTYALDLVAKENFETIHFFGDKTMPGGNDYQIYNDPRVVGHSVKNPEDTVAQLKNLFQFNI